ncbi:hypothetical protein QE152_g884 [Popillia japonica]|uniref:Uncharacterized protein n=1 Tax=Popillia japonica TaxID=7064 RepID=A0AAW1N565_POPJA
MFFPIYTCTATCDDFPYDLTIDQPSGRSDREGGLPTHNATRSGDCMQERTTLGMREEDGHGMFYVTGAYRCLLRLRSTSNYKTFLLPVTVRPQN